MIADCFVTHGLLTEHQYHCLYICLARAVHPEHIYTVGGGVGSPSFNFTTSNPACNPTPPLTNYHPFKQYITQDCNISATIESANTAAVTHCYTCHLTGHLAKDCPHTAVIDCLVADHANYRNKDKWRNKPNQAPNNTMTTPSMNTANTNHVMLTPSIGNALKGNTAHIAKAAGVVTSFLCTALHTDWLCDSGATSSMSSNCSVFLSLKPERHAIQIANGNVIYSEGLGLRRFVAFWFFWTVLVRIGALAQYDFLYGLIYRIFLVFLGLFPVCFGLFG
jgi:hypothetical protein